MSYFSCEGYASSNVIAIVCSDCLSRVSGCNNVLNPLILFHCFASTFFSCLLLLVDSSWIFAFRSFFFLFYFKMSWSQSSIGNWSFGQNSPLSSSSPSSLGTNNSEREVDNSFVPQCFLFILGSMDLELIRAQFRLLLEYKLKVPSPNVCMCDPLKGQLGLYEEYLWAG